MAAPDWSLQRDLIRLLVKRVEVDHDEINVVFRVAPPPASLPPGSEGGRSWQDCWRGDDPSCERASARVRRFFDPPIEFLFEAEVGAYRLPHFASLNTQQYYRYRC